YDDVSADHAMMGATIFDPSNTNNGNSTGAAQLMANSLFTPIILGVPQPTAAGATAIQPFLNRNTTWVGYNTRFNNSVKYITPNFGGFSGSLMYGFGEDKTASAPATATTAAVVGVGATKVWSGNLKYANGPLVISGGYQSETTPGSRTTTLEPALQNTLLNVAYDFGVVKLGFGANRAKYKDVIVPVNVVTGRAAHEVAPQKEYSLSLAIPLGATTVSMGYARSKGDDLGSSTGYGIQALYSLSKRTTLYVGGQSTKNYDGIANAVNTYYPGSNISRTTTYAAGMRHTF
ncbi:MAG: porin, partial [Polaromonas sp.]